MLKSLRIALLVTFVCVLIAYPAAWAIAKIVPPKYRNMLIMVAIVPAFTSQLLLIHSIMLLFQSNGVVMKALESIGITSAKGSILYSTPAVILILIYEYLPYMMLCLYSCLEKIDDNVIEASHSLGAGRVRTFLNVVLPQSLSGLFVGFLIVFIPVAGSFVEPKVAGGPYGMMVGSLIDAQFTTVLNMGYGAALSLVFLLVMAAILAVVNFVFRRTEKVIGG
jgi:spermidine/putrescine transport system permease protein